MSESLSLVPRRNLRGVSLVTLLLAIMGLPACEKISAPAPAAQQGVREIAWARVALERNPHLEVVATDTDAGVFTVRDKRTGAVRAIKLSEIAAVPVQELQAPRTALAPGEATAAQGARTTSPQDPARQSNEDARVADADDDAPGETGEKDASQSASSDSAQGPGYTIERSAGQVKVSGPGVSIVSAAEPSDLASRNEANQRTSDPIVCEGRRMMHLDGRTIHADGDAIIARGGCELHITNSRIVATGRGLVVQGAAVHVNNSDIQGGSAAFDADGSAKMFMRGSTFNGAQRKHPYAVIQDLGGNQFRQNGSGAE